MLLRTKADPVQFMSDVRERIGQVENDIDILLNTIHGKDPGHQEITYKSGGSGKNSVKQASVNNKFESRSEYVPSYEKDTFLSKFNRLNVDYERANKKYKDQKIEDSRTSHLNNGMSKNGN